MIWGLLHAKNGENRCYLSVNSALTTKTYAYSRRVQREVRVDEVLSQFRRGAEPEHILAHSRDYKMR